jgi:AcrR family transcriptional regulator
MPRRKSIPDEVVLDRLMTAISASGPASLTFAQAAAAVGLSPATLVQRFGTLDAMIEAILLRAWDRLKARTMQADAEMPLTTEGAIELLMRLMPADGIEHGVTDGLLLLREDLRNPALRARASAWAHLLAHALGRRLSADAIRAERLGRQMVCVWQGALIWWGFTREAPPETAIREMMIEWCRTARLA